MKTEYFHPLCLKAEITPTSCVLEKQELYHVVSNAVFLTLEEKMNCRERRTFASLVAGQLEIAEYESLLRSLAIGP